MSFLRSFQVIQFINKTNSFLSGQYLCSFRWFSRMTRPNSEKHDVSEDMEDDLSGLELNQLPKARQFRVLHIPGYHKVEVQPRKKRTRESFAARSQQMHPDQDWTAVWPAAATFRPSVVPFPVRQGFSKNPRKVPPGPFANAELMKIPNFLHLTPAHIEKHCQALKKFCTEWPEQLQTDEQCDRVFPLTLRYTHYAHTAHTIRTPFARAVTLRVSLDRLDLDYHARDKFIRLVGDRYIPKDGMVTFTVDRCPLRAQNIDYAYYLLTAVYHESWKTEDWEAEKSQDDWERFYWEKSRSAQTATELVQTLSDQQLSSEEIRQLPKVRNFKDAVEKLHEEENRQTLTDYKQAVLGLIQKQTAVSRPE